MSSKLQPVRGTHDILPDEFEKFHAVVTRARELATLYGFKEMATPIFEPTEVFARSMGETSDVVNKEMFTFTTKGDESVTLRPEFTAGVVRAFLSNGMQQHLPLKLFSTGPLFRYERPQKGRQRQFHQVNFEWLGDDSAEADIEIIKLAGYMLFSLSGSKCILYINSLGDRESREKYREALVNHLTPFKNDLSEDSQRRLVSNPLRILDSKNEEDKKITSNAPKIINYLSKDAEKRFEYICENLNFKDAPYILKQNKSLVRGLDYYTDTVFEFISNDGDLGAQNTILAGGRYDGLVEQMGGDPTPAIGFAAGVERLILSVQDYKISKLSDAKLILLPLEDADPKHVHSTALLCRMKIFEYLKENRLNRNCSVEIFWKGKLDKRLDKAIKKDATHVMIIGAEEHKNFTYKIKDIHTRNEVPISFEELKESSKLAHVLNIELDSGLRRNDEGKR